MFVIVILAGGISHAATFSMLAVAVNDGAVTPTDSVTIHPGDVVECEIYLSGWGEDDFCDAGSANAYDRCSADADCVGGA